MGKAQSRDGWMDGEMSLAYTVLPASGILSRCMSRVASISYLLASCPLTHSLTPSPPFQIDSKPKPLVWIST